MGIGNSNPIKLARCVIELERIYGIKNGGNRKSEVDNTQLKTQKQLAENLNIDRSQLINYKKLSNLIPELQTLVETNQLKGTTAYKIWAKLQKE